MNDGDDDDLDREAILARRRRFMAAALSGLVMTQCASTAQPCLRVGQDSAVDTGSPGDTGRDTGPQPCLTVDAALDTGRDAGFDVGPQPCLEPPLDAGFDTSPQPCLSVAIDAGPPDAGPLPCLSPLPPDSGR